VSPVRRSKNGKSGEVNTRRHHSTGSTRQGGILLRAEAESMLWRSALPRGGWRRKAPRDRLQTRLLTQRQITGEERRTRPARLWQRQGQRTAARGLLAPVHGWFSEGFDTTDLQEAKELLERLA
jgi:hypothetical protein